MIEEMTRYEALIACRDAAGSDSQLARDLGISQPKVWRWVHQSKQLPSEYVLEAERLYGVPRHFLRPDIYPADLGPAPRWHGVDQRVDRFQAAVMARGGAVSKRGGSRRTAA